MDKVTRCYHSGALFVKESLPPGFRRLVCGLCGHVIRRWYVKPNGSVA